MEIPVGDFVALMGPSGSGKTTLLNQIGGLDRPDGGYVEVMGQRLDQMSGRRLAHWRARHIGLVFQTYNLLPALTAARNVEFPLLLTNLSRKDRREHVAAALTLVGLSERAKHYPRQLSGGEEQRVAVARAIVSDPDILLCDEPTGDLDRNTGDEIMKLLRILNEEHGKTILVVTHDPRAAEVAGRILYLGDGLLGTEPAA
ncbi:MAG: ABC transporter ATP-binding protein [bacterium]|nr:ABC transporter ATP-binding protein [bacterium]